MAESSYLWTTNGTGDGAVPYTRTDWSIVSRILGWGNGIIPGFLNGFSSTILGANSLRINSGGAVVDGKPYYNSTTVDLNIPSTIGAGNSRIDRIVLRANWSAQTVRLHRIEGADPGANPTVPAYTQTPGNTWDLPLYQVRVNDLGVLSNIVDERVYIQVPTLGLGAGAVTTDKLANGAVTNAKLGNGSVTGAVIANNAIDNTKIRDSAALSVIGRASNSTGDPADIAAGSDNTVLRRSGTALGWAQVGTALLADSSVVTTKISGGAVTNAKLATDAVSNDKIVDGAVDDVKVGNRVVKAGYRKGGHATNWYVAGNNSYQVGKIQIVFGKFSGSIAAGVGQESNTVYFPTQSPFSAPPLVIPVLTGGPADGSVQPSISLPGGVTTLEAFSAIYTRTNTASVAVYDFAWIAIGPTA